MSSSSCSASSVRAGKWRKRDSVTKRSSKPRQILPSVIKSHQMPSWLTTLFLPGAGPSSFGPDCRTPSRLFCVLSTAQLYSSVLAPELVSRISLCCSFLFSSRSGIALPRFVFLDRWKVQSTKYFSSICIMIVERAHGKYPDYIVSFIMDYTNLLRRCYANRHYRTPISCQSPSSFSVWPLFLRGRV